MVPRPFMRLLPVLMLGQAVYSIASACVVRRPTNTLGWMSQTRKSSSPRYRRTRSINSATNESQESSKHDKNYRLRGSTSEKSKSGVTLMTNTGHVVSTDLPNRMGGRDLAPQPVELLMSSLIGCTQATALFVARNMKPDRLLIDRMEFDLKGTRDERGALSLPIEESPTIPSRLQLVSGTVKVFLVNGKEISDESMDLLKEQTELRCPVANMIVSSGCKMDVTWIDGSKL